VLALDDSHNSHKPGKKYLTMLLPYIVSLAIVSSVFASENAPKLRGTKIYRPEEIYAGQDASLKKQEQALKALLENFAEPGANVKRTPSLLEYQGGNPQLSFDGYLVNKYHAGGECSGEGSQQFSLSMDLFSDCFTICIG
jgi:hypothetical protein